MSTPPKDPWNQNPWGKPPAPQGLSGGPKKTPTPADMEALLRHSQERLKHLLGVGGGSSGGGGGSGGAPRPGRGVAWLAGGAVCLWVLSGFFLVKADELGVISRFGAFSRTSPPGLHYHLPYPVETARTPKVTVVNRTEVGFSSASVRGNKPLSKPEESLMLTKDENIVDIQFEVQWRIGKAEEYLFNLRNPEKTVKSVAESAMREAVGQMDIISVLGGGEGKLQVEQHTRRLMQDMLDNYKAGVEIVAINLTQPEPPAEVLDAWRDVQSARVDMETERNKALAYRNDILPRARGQAEQIVQDAEAYKQQAVSKATGEAARFESVYKEYRLAPDATARRMYIETMEEVLKRMQKVIIDGKAGSGALPFLPLGDLKPKSQEARP